MSREELEHKFARCTSEFLAEKQVSEILDLLNKLEEVESIRDLMNKITSAKKMKK
jgi:hypothetical protein